MTNHHPQSQRSYSKRFLARLIEQQGGKCHWCDCEIVRRRAIRRGVIPNKDQSIVSFYRHGKKTTKARATVDHIVPLSRGGSRELPNLVAACVACNAFRNHAQQLVDAFDAVRDCENLEQAERAALIAGLRDVAAGRVKPLKRIRLEVFGR